MPSRNWFLRYLGLWLVLAAATACIEAQEEKRATQPPPIVGTGTGRSASAAQAAPAGNASAAQSAPVTRVTSPAADGGKPARMEPADSDLDAGPGTAGAGAAGASGRAGSSGAAAGSGALGRAGSGGQGGIGGRTGAGGQGGGQASDACMNQFCLSVLDCWLFSLEDCAYVACDNFVCR